MDLQLANIPYPLTPLIVKLKLQGIKDEEISVEFLHFAPMLERHPSELLSDTEGHRFLRENLNKWINSHFDRKGKETYFDVLVNHVTITSVLLDPRLPITSKAMEISTYLWAWIWIMDDWMDNCQDIKSKPFGFGEFSSVIIRLKDIFKEPPKSGQVKTINSSQMDQNITIVDRLYRALENFLELCSDVILDFDKRKQMFVFYVAEYLDALEWFYGQNFDKNLSEQTFSYWRRIESFCKPTVEFLVLLHSVSISDEIRFHPAVQRYIKIYDTIATFSNDVLGLQRDLLKGNGDSLVLFKTNKKKAKLMDAISEVVNHVNVNAQDFVLLNELLVCQLFPNNCRLNSYINILQSTMHGIYQMYVHSPRYLSEGQAEILLK